MILGITGPIGCGKSTLLSLFRDAGWRVTDADLLCRRMYEDPAGELAEFCRSEWGDKIFSFGKIDREKIARIVFCDQAALKKLTGFIYPVLERKITEFIEEARSAGINAVIEIPLLFESGMEKFFDGIVAVWADVELRHQRLRDFRNFDEAEIRRREERQLSADIKLERADYALINSGDTLFLKRQFDILQEQLSNSFRK